MSDFQALPDPPWAGRTEAVVRAGMLAAVPDSFNKAQGDIVYDMVTPTAIEIERLYAALEVSLGECFVTTASGGYLDALGLQLAGLTRLAGQSDTTFRNAVIARLKAPAGAGNVADYLTWAYAAGANVGFAAVEALWNGPGTVRVLGATPDRTALSGTQIATLQAYLASKAPIGHTVTAGSVTIRTVGVVVNVDLFPGYTLTNAIRDGIKAKIRSYIDSLQPGDDVFWSEVVAAVMDAEGVANITDSGQSLDINGVSADLAIATTQLAALGTVTIL